LPNSASNIATASANVMKFGGLVVGFGRRFTDVGDPGFRWLICSTHGSPHHQPPDRDGHGRYPKALSRADMSP
jgi:hypothetical protein